MKYVIYVGDMTFMNYVPSRLNGQYTLPLLTYQYNPTLALLLVPSLPTLPAYRPYLPTYLTCLPTYLTVNIHLTQKTTPSLSNLIHRTFITYLLIYLLSYLLEVPRVPLFIL